MKKNFSFLVPIIFFFISLLLIRNHEMWRDEIQAWLLVRDSTNLISLTENLKYEGSTGLWHYLLYPLTRIFRNPYSMQLIHIFISTISIFVIFNWSPFNRLQKILLSFSYFLFYEYSVISRNYGLSALLIFIFCALFKDRNKNKIKLSLILFLLSHTSFFGLIMAFCLFITLIIEEFFNNFINNQSFIILFKKSNAISFFISLSGFITSLIQLSPPKDSPLVNTEVIVPSLSKLIAVFQSLVKSYIPIPYLELSFWGTSFARDSILLKIIITITFISIVWIFFSYFKKKPSIIFLYLSSSTILISFFLFKYIGLIRHHGFLFLTLLSCLWIYTYCSDFNKKAHKKNEARLIKKTNITTTFLFSLQALAGVIAASYDYVFPFSSAKETAIFIKKNNLSRSEIIGYKDFTASAVLGHLEDKKSFYYVQSESYGSFISWDDKREKKVNYEILLKESKKLYSKGNGVILVLNNSLKDLGYPEYYFKKIFTSKDSIVKDEKFHVYRYIDLEK